LIACREAGRQRFYRAQKHALGPVSSWLEEMWDGALYDLKIRVELEEARRGPRPRRRRARP
ncbi:MAG TPA: hypothetical protein VJT73_16250, partial [Polyangiaceae bacterium]|nr:hypothetical protein [Polyangiaceae bacterium]